MSYAFVFLNAIVGFLSGLLRIAKAMILGLFFFSRLDRTVLMPGFQRWDKGKLPEKRMLRKLIPPCSSLLTYHLPFSACRTVVCLPKSWKIEQLLVASQTLLLTAFDFFFKLPKHLNNNATRHDGLEKGLGEGDRRILVVSQWNLWTLPPLQSSLAVNLQ